MGKTRAPLTSTRDARASAVSVAKGRGKNAVASTRRWSGQGDGGAREGANDDGADDFDVDALFGKAKKAKKKSADAVEEAARRSSGGAGGARVGAGAGAGTGSTAGARVVLLPGQKKPKQKRATPEFTPVEKPRRFEDGLPVYKSYDDFSDMAHGQAGVGGDGKKLGPNGEPGGECPFDCWCCF